MTDVPLALSRTRRLPEGVIRLLRELAQDQGDPVRITLDVLQDDEAWRRTVAALFPGIPTAPGDQPEATFEGRQLPEVAVATVVQHYISDDLLSPELSRYWQYILACGVACAELAACMSLKTSLAFSCGILHDLGRLALMTAYADQYMNLFTTSQRLLARNESINISAQERRLFGCDRFEAGEWLIEEWGLPPFFQPILGRFQSTRVATIADLAALTSAGCSLVYSFGYGLMLGAPHRNIQEVILLLPRCVLHKFQPDLSGLKRIVDRTLQRWPKSMQFTAERPAA